MCQLQNVVFVVEMTRVSMNPLVPSNNGLVETSNQHVVVATSDVTSVRHTFENKSPFHKRYMNKNFIPEISPSSRMVMQKELQFTGSKVLGDVCVN